MILTRKTVRFILQNPLSQDLILWSKNVSFPEEIIFATLARINKQQFLETGMVAQNHEKRSRTFPLCQRYLCIKIIETMIYLFWIMHPPKYLVGCVIEKWYLWVYPVYVLEKHYGIMPLNIVMVKIDDGCVILDFEI